MWLFQILPETDLAGFRNSNPAGAGSRYGENLFSDHKTTHLMKLMGSTMPSAATEALQFTVSFVLMSLFASSWRNLWNSNGFSILYPGNTN